MVLQPGLTFPPVQVPLKLDPSRNDLEDLHGAVLAADLRGSGSARGTAGPSPAAPEPLPAGLTASCVPVLLATMLQMGPPPPSMPRAALSPDRSYSVMSPLSPAPNSRSPTVQHSDSTDRNSCPGITCAGTGSHHGTDRDHPVRTGRAR